MGPFRDLQPTGDPGHDSVLENIQDSPPGSGFSRPVVWTGPCSTKTPCEQGEFTRVSVTGVGSWPSADDPCTASHTPPTVFEPTTLSGSRASLQACKAQRPSDPPGWRSAQAPLRVPRSLASTPRDRAARQDSEPSVATKAPCLAGESPRKPCLIGDDTSPHVLLPGATSPERAVLSTGRHPAGRASDLGRSGSSRPASRARF